MTRQDLRRLVEVGVEQAASSWVCAGVTMKKVGPEILKALDRLDELERLHAGPVTKEGVTDGP